MEVILFTYVPIIETLQYTYGYTLSYGYITRKCVIHN